MNKEYQANAEQDLKNHKYICLVKNENIEAWHCGIYGSSYYAFDILITRYGIAVVGDIDSLTFRVGMSYGMEFLAGSDIDYYICSKLENKSEKKEFDEEYFYKILKEHLLDWIEENYEEDEEDFNIRDVTKIVKKESFKDLVDFIERNHTHFDKPIYEDLMCALNKLDCMDFLDARSVYEWMNNNMDELGLNDMMDYNFERTSTNVMQTLYYINHAAKEIMKIRGSDV